MIRLLASIVTASVLCVSVSLDAAEKATRTRKPKPLPPASAKKLPRWRGFNLLEKFYVTKRQPFVEEDFELISELGFNRAEDRRCDPRRGPAAARHLGRHAVWAASNL